MMPPETKIEWRDVSTITPYENNAKKHPKKQVQQVADSIREFGFNQPIVLDQAGVIIVGHGRFAAAKLLDLGQVPTITVDIDEEKAKAYRLADNKLNESDWDMDLVVAELKELSLPMLDLTGFSRDLVLENDDKDDVVPGAPDVPRSKPGDVYQLGRHRVVCGDSTKPETYAVLMEKQNADMVFTDPPYNVDYSGRGETTKRKIENDNMGAGAFDVFLVSFFKAAVMHTKAGAGWYVFHSPTTQDQFRLALEEAGLEMSAQLIWNKPTVSMGWGDYRSKHEPFFYAGRKDTKLVFYGDRSHKTVLDFHASEKELIAWVKREKRLEAEGKTTIWSVNRDKVNEYAHPTQKPVELITYALVNSSKAGDIVLDPFLGSGSTVIAAEKTERTAFGVEIDPTFVDVIVQRWVDYTQCSEVVRNGEVELWQPSFIDSVEETDAPAEPVDAAR